MRFDARLRPTPCRPSRCAKTPRSRRTIEANGIDEAGALVKALNTMKLNLNPAANVAEARWPKANRNR